MSTPTAEDLLAEASRCVGSGWDRHTGFSAIATLLADRCVETEKRLATALVEISRLKTCSTIEMMCENVNVDSHVREWEDRCLKAEAEVERLRTENVMLQLVRLRAVLDEIEKEEKP